MLRIVFPFLICICLNTFAFGQTESSKKTDCTKVETGIVRLRVELLATGKVGKIEVIQGLPHGLTDQAVSAAGKIKFEPKVIDGIAQTVTRVVEYTFTIYEQFDENSPELVTKAQIKKIPVPSFSKDQVRAYGGQVIEVELIFESDGDIELLHIKGDFPDSIKQTARKAASKISFEPAIHKCGKKVSQNATIKFEIK